jgi:Flp pilus assembly protein TadD
MGDVMFTHQRPVGRLRADNNHAIPYVVKGNMPTLQEEYDEAMYAFSTGNLDGAIEQFKSILIREPNYFDAQLSLGVAYYRKGDYTSALAEGHKAEQLSPKDQLVHTNLSLFYVKLGDKAKAEHHGLQARIASWRENGVSQEPGADDSLVMAKPATPPPPQKFPDMPWKKKSS